jgi:hypothetical protein
VTEAEWLSCTNPKPMLEFVRGRASDRKLRLFAAACARHLWGSTEDEATAAFLAAADRLAEAGGMRVRTSRVRVPAGEVAIECGASDPVGPVWSVGPDGSRRAVDPGKVHPVLRAILEQVACWPPGHLLPAWLPLHLDHAGLGLARQAGLLRDIVRGPFRPIFLGPACPRPNDDTIVRLAEAIYEARAFNKLPALADALVEAGCGDEQVLTHCRRRGGHVRGCWLLDVLLRKE